MTTTSTENHSVEAYQIAITLLTRLAKPFFNNALLSAKDPNPSNHVMTPREKSMWRHWEALKRIAASISINRSAALPPASKEEIRVAFELLHQMEHDGQLGGAPDVARCNCGIAQDILMFAEVAESERTAAA